MRRGRYAAAIQGPLQSRTRLSRRTARLARGNASRRDEESSEKLEFERAAQLRDKMLRLESLREQFERLRFAVESLSFVYHVPGHGEDDRAYVIRRGRVRAELPAPKTADEHSALAARAAEIFAPSELKSTTVPAHEVDELMLLSSWFRKFPAELTRTIPAADYPRARTA